jgi:hypothetical protein
MQIHGAADIDVIGEYCVVRLGVCRHHLQQRMLLADDERPRGVEAAVQ